MGSIQHSFVLEETFTLSSANHTKRRRSGWSKLSQRRRNGENCLSKELGVENEEDEQDEDDDDTCREELLLVHPTVQISLNERK